MPYSYGIYKKEFANHLTELMPPNSLILDVGAGSGAYGEILKPSFPNIDAIEIFEPYIHMFKLGEKYRNIFCGDIFEFDFTGYDYILLGDIIEHMTVEKAQELINRVCEMNMKCMVSVPYLFEQGIEFNNEFEIHLQPDLTHELFLQRYPQMTLFWKDERYGYYTNY